MNEYRHELRLATGAKLTILDFRDEDEVRYLFEYRYRHVEDGKRKPKVVIDYRLVVDYAAGQLKDELTLSMHVIVPEKLGRQYVYGVDISPGAKTYLEFLYRRKQDNLFKLAAVGKGAAPPEEIPTEAGLMKPIELPFTLLDGITTNLGGEGTYFMIPFHYATREDSGLAYFQFPASIKVKF